MAAHRNDASVFFDRGKWRPGFALVFSDGFFHGCSTGEQDDAFFAIGPRHTVQSRDLFGGGPVVRSGQSVAPSLTAVSATFVNDSTTAVTFGVNGEDGFLVIEQASGYVTEILAFFNVDNDLPVFFSGEIDEWKLDR